MAFTKFHYCFALLYLVSLGQLLKRFMPFCPAHKHYCCFSQICLVEQINDNIIIIINDNVYGAVIVTMVTARVHPVHLMNAD